MGKLREWRRILHYVILFISICICITVEVSKNSLAHGDPTLSSLRSLVHHEVYMLLDVLQPSQTNQELEEKQDYLAMMSTQLYMTGQVMMKSQL